MIIEASAAHAAVIAALHAASFEEAWPAPEIARLMAMPGAIALMALGDGGEDSPQGFLIARRAADEAEILSIATLPQARRRRIASALIRALLARLALCEVASLHIEVAAGNAAALAFYGRLGFESVGRRKGYYAHVDGRREDAVLMRLSVPAALQEPHPRPIPGPPDSEER